MSDYNDLPAPLKREYTETEYKWMSEEYRHDLEVSEGLPDDDEDD